MSRQEYDDHERWAELAAGYALSALEPAEDAEFRAHLSGCPACQAAVDAHERVAAEMAAAVPPAAPPPGLWDAITAGLDSRDDPPPVPVPEPRPEAEPVAEPDAGRVAEVVPLADRRRRTRRWLAAAAAAAVVLAGAGLAAGLAGRHGSAPTEAQRISRLLDAPGARTARLAPTEGGGGAVATAVVTADRRLYLVVDGLAANDPRRNTYVLWSTRNAGAPRAVTAFDVKDSGRHLVPAGRAPAGALPQGFAVSEEQGRTPPPEPTRLVAAGDLS